MEPSPVSPGLERVAVLERRIEASLERVWENVHDWEHLPWLHHHDFAAIEIEEAGPWGWRAHVTSTVPDRAPFRLELLTEHEERRYVSRTLTGVGAGSEIWTWLDPVTEHATAIRVEFWLPGVPEAMRDRVGENYLRLYHRLWDEDEAMMGERTAQLRPREKAAPPIERVDLGPRDRLLSALPLCVEFGGARFRVAALEDELIVHDARCPHRLGPLDEGAIQGQEVTCPWHGYRFDVRTGRSSDGRRLRLRKPPAIEHDPETDRVYLVTASAR